jgi:hypothetical protein
MEGVIFYKLIPFYPSILAAKLSNWLKMPKITEHREEFGHYIGL